jgi:hypothetical protein
MNKLAAAVVCVALIAGAVLLARGGWGLETITGLVLVLGSTITPLLVTQQRTGRMLDGEMRAQVEAAVEAAIGERLERIAHNVQTLRSRSDDP